MADNSNNQMRLETDGETRTPRRICVTGGRDFNDRELVERAFREVSAMPGDVLVEGEATGADRLCAEVAGEMGLLIEPHHARWGSYGKAAGTIRNTEMLESGVDLLLSFPGGKGTRHCTKKAQEMGIPVVFAKSRPDRIDESKDVPVTKPAAPSPVTTSRGDPWESLLRLE